MLKTKVHPGNHRPCPACGVADREGIREHDIQMTGKLTAMGYAVIRISEHEIKKHDFTKLASLTPEGAVA
jgi:hypothetical protein